MKPYKCFECLGWRFTLTPLRVVLAGVLAVMGAVVALRLLTGFQYVTNLSDDTPWGLWIAFDVLCGVALAGGGYSTALLVNIFRCEQYEVVERGALLTSLLGYLLVMVGLSLDIGQWFNFWQPFVSWGYTSVLFEVFWCISLYITVQSFEFLEIALERIKLDPLHTVMKLIRPLLIIVALIFPMMHQSSLGGLFLIMKEKMFPLWWSEFLPLYFLMSSFFLGSAMVTVESYFAKKAYGHEVKHEVLLSLNRVGARIMLVYLLMKLYDLATRQQWGNVFQGNLQSNLYCLELLLGIIVPLLIIFTPLAKKEAGLMAYAGLVVLGVIGNRMNCVFTSLYETGNYFPHPGEFIVSGGLVAAGILMYCFVVENFNIIGNERATQVKIVADNDIKKLL